MLRTTDIPEATRLLNEYFSLSQALKAADIEGGYIGYAYRPQLFATWSNDRLSLSKEDAIAFLSKRAGTVREKLLGLDIEVQDIQLVEKQEASNG